MNILPSELAYHLTQAIERIAASEAQTQASILASRLYHHLRDLEMIERGLAKIIAVDQSRKLVDQIMRHEPEASKNRTKRRSKPRKH
jgi:hypothetical protein